MTLLQNDSSEIPVRPPYNWFKLIFFWLIHIVALLGFVLWCTDTLTFSWQTYVLAFVMFCASSTAITAGYHRLFSHPTYTALWPVRMFHLVMGAASLQGSAMQWSAQHRDHHKYCDKPKDPYNILLGFWYAHWGWVIRKTNPDYNTVKDLAKFKLVTLQHALYMPIAIFFGFVLPTLIALLWGEALQALLMVGFIRIVAQWHFTFNVNSVAHYFGTQKYSTKDSSRGSWWYAYITWGEAQDHDRHHTLQMDYRTGVRWYDFDPGKWFIWICCLLRLASNPRRFTHASDN